MIESKIFIPQSIDTDQKEAYRDLVLTQEEISKISRGRTLETVVPSSQGD